METLKYILIKLVDWKTRQRKIQYLTMLLGAGMLSANKYLGQSLTLQKGSPTRPVYVRRKHHHGLLRQYRGYPHHLGRIYLVAHRRLPGG